MSAVAAVLPLNGAAAVSPPADVRPRPRGEAFSMHEQPRIDPRDANAQRENFDQLQRRHSAG